MVELDAEIDAEIAAEQEKRSAPLPAVKFGTDFEAFKADGWLKKMRDYFNASVGDTDGNNNNGGRIHFAAGFCNCRSGWIWEDDAFEGCSTIF